MSVNSITSSTGQDMLSTIQSATTNSSDLDQVKTEVKQSGQDMTAQQISSKYGVSLTDAQKILKELEESNSSSTAAITSANGGEVTVPDDNTASTIAYRA